MNGRVIFFHSFRFCYHIFTQQIIILYVGTLGLAHIDVNANNIIFLP